MLLEILCCIGMNMPDPKLLKAYRMAQQMDQQGQVEEETQRTDEVDSFLNTIGQIESSGGENLNHEEIQNGMHKGHRAAGTYGLMPNTISETLNRMRLSGEINPELQSLQGLDPAQLKATVESNPDIEQQLAKFVARRALNRQNLDQEKAAYSWFQGHNLSPQEIEERNYKEHDYVKKFNKYRGE